jgi:hypothetical protein
VYSFFAVKKQAGPEFAVSIDLSKPLAIQWPCEILIVGDGGEKGLRIAPKVGRGWCNEAGGQAVYKFYVPQEGKYHIWAYALWFDVCTNAIFAQIDDLDKVIIGNDPIYKKWHWVRGFDVNLKKGTHSLVLSNHSDHIALQKIVFLNSAAEPQQTGLVFSDIFYDDFDGCDQGNFADWTIINGKWHVRNTDSATSLLENSLIGDCQDKAFIIYEQDSWPNYCLDISFKLLPLQSEDHSVGICFGVSDPNNFWQLQLTPNQYDKTAKISVIKKKLSIPIVVYEWEHPFEINKWQKIHIALEDELIEVKLAENDAVRIEANQKIAGGIGFLLQGQVTAYFDDVHVIKKIANSQRSKLNRKVK